MNMNLRKKLFTSLSAGLVAAACAGPASAELLLNTSVTQTGTGLGAVSTVVTVMDNNSGPNQNGIESGCVSSTLGTGAINFTCLNGLQGGDNQAQNFLVTPSTLTGITSASQLALILNISEPGNDDTAILTHLYLAVFSPTGVLLGNHIYTAPVGGLTIIESPGVGSQGTVFTLSVAEQTAINLECPILANCRIGGGLQFALNSTDGALETVNLGFVTNGTLPPPSQIPEPASLALVGLGLVGLAGLRRRKA